MSEQSEMSKALGVPWKARGCDVFDDTDELVCVTFIATDAAFISSRINAHDSLVKALTECLAEHGGFTVSGECERKARAALRLAEEPTLDPAGLVSP